MVLGQFYTSSRFSKFNKGHYRPTYSSFIQKDLFSRTYFDFVVTGTVSRDFLHLFLNQKHHLGPIWTCRQKRFAEILVFAKIFAKNASPRSQGLRGQRVVPLLWCIPYFFATAMWCYPAVSSRSCLLSSKFPRYTAVKLFLYPPVLFASIGE